MEKQNRHAEKSRNSKLKLLHAALELFVQRGFSEVSVNDICRMAGMTKGAFYHHFSSKEEIYLQILVPRLDNYLEQNYKPSDAATTGERLTRLAHCVFDVSKRMGRELLAQDFNRLLTLKASDIYKPQRTYTRILSETISSGMAKGDISSGLNIEHNIMLYACLLTGFLVRWSAANDEDDRLIDWNALLDREIALFVNH